MTATYRRLLPALLAAFVLSGVLFAAPVAAVEDPLPDTAAPTTLGWLDSTAGNDGWSIAAVTVTLEAQDDDSGVAATSYILDGSAEAPYSAPFAVTAEGAHSLSFWSRDEAGNLEAPTDFEFKIDAINPAVDAVIVEGTPGEDDWYTSDVTVGASASDATSGIAGVVYRLNNGAWTTYTTPFVVSGDGVHDLDIVATDGAGNVNLASRAVMITGTGTPMATPTPSPTPVPTATPVPSASPSPTPSAAPTATPSPTPSLTPSPTPSATPAPTTNPSPTPSPTPSSTPSPSPTPKPTPTPTPKPAYHSLNLYTSAIRNQDPDYTACVAASTLNMLNMIADKSPSKTAGFRWHRTTSYATQESVLRWERAHMTMVKYHRGVDPNGWRNGLNYYGWGTYKDPAKMVYKVFADSSYDAAAKRAIVAMARYGKPVGILGWNGGHAQVLNGYKVYGADPRTGSLDFKVVGVYITDPLRSDGYHNKYITNATWRSGNLHIRFTKYTWRDSPYDDPYTPGTKAAYKAWYGKWVIVAPVR